MRFLTRAWHAGNGPYEDDKLIAAAYREHRASVLPMLPPRFRAFVETVNIHDALVREIRLDREASTLEIDLRAGDLQVGYFDLAIRYEGVDLQSLDSTVLATIGRNPRAEALYDEIDVAPNGWYEHRWLWWPYQDLDIRFQRFEYATAPQPDRSFQRSADSYAEIRAPAD